MPKEEVLPWEQAEERQFTFKCKVVYNFQSIEFDYTGTPADITDMMSIYKQCLDELQAVSVDQPKPVSVKPREELATERQKEILDRHGIEYDKNITKKEATRLITKSLTGGY